MPPTVTETAIHVPSRIKPTFHVPSLVEPAFAATRIEEQPDYFSEVHPEFAAALVLHWLLWGYASREVALAYDFLGIAELLWENTPKG